MKLTIKRAAALGVVASFAAMYVTHAQAADPLITKWEKLNDDCIGQPTLKNGRDNPSCNKRDALTPTLTKGGYMRGNHDLWLSPSTQKWFATVVATRPTTPDQALEALRNRIADVEIFGVWNQTHNDIRDRDARTWAVMSEMMNKLARKYSVSKDVLLTLDY